MPPLEKINKSLLRRILKIDEMIRQCHYPTKKQIADEYGSISVKTIQRDIEMMQTVFNAPIEYDNKIKGYYYSDKNFRLKHFDLDENDFFALAVTEKVMQQFKNSPLEPKLRKFYEKINLLFDGKVTVKTSELNEILSWKLGETRNVDSKTFGIIQNAIRNSKTIYITYYTASTDKTSERNVDPYHLLNNYGEWYLIGYCHLRKEIKLFAVSRISKIELLKQEFFVKDGFTPEEYLKDSLGVFESKELIYVKLWFSAQDARYIKEKKIHHSQKITDNPDATIYLELKIPDTYELMMYILMHGNGCKVIEPKSLRDKVKRELSKTISHY